MRATNRRTIYFHKTLLVLNLPMLICQTGGLRGEFGIACIQEVRPFSIVLQRQRFA